MGILLTFIYFSIPWIHDVYDVISLVSQPEVRRWTSAWLIYFFDIGGYFGE